ncbi:hypothetical protein [Spiroplasma endosymbiont of Amphimallon solstitiale]|uniref:hypothetical protein n=1 Tax=Spiroplasma endosymbiont of Amphimallon solstitiale TaxID=3066288 RepID=UPI00313C0601
MNNGSIVINTVYSFQINEIVNKQSNKEKQQEYKKDYINLIRNGKWKKVKYDIKRIKKKWENMLKGPK